MPMLARGFKRLAQGLLAIVLVLAALWIYGRWTSPTPAQQAAMDLMSAPSRASAATGENGFLLSFDLPSIPSGMPMVCNGGDPCLPRIEGETTNRDAWLGEATTAIAATERVLRAPRFVDDRSAADWQELLPPFRNFTHLPTWRAMAFHFGDQTEAMTAACQDAVDFNRWMRAPDNLVQAMVAHAAFNLSIDVLVEMRGAAPELALPATCGQLSETPDPVEEGMACEAMKGEWRFQNRFLPSMNTGGFFQALLLNNEYLQARLAETFSHTCGPEAEAAARADRPPVYVPTAPRWVDHIAQPIGVVLADVATPAFSSHPPKYLDHLARRRLFAAYLQMQSMDAALPLPERFAALPSALRDGPRPLRLSDDGQGIEVDLRFGRDNEPKVWRLSVR